jgi:hypothetical protein
MTRRRTLSIIANVTGAVMDTDKAEALIAPMLSDHRPRCRVSDTKRQISFLRILRREFARRRTRRSGRERFFTTINLGMRIAHGSGPDGRYCGTFSAVNFPPVSNAINADDPLGVSNFIDHTIVADANPPIILTPGKACGNLAGRGFLESASTARTIRS